VVGLLSGIAAGWVGTTLSSCGASRGGTETARFGWGTIGAQPRIVGWGAWVEILDSMRDILRPFAGTKKPSHRLHEGCRKTASTNGPPVYLPNQLPGNRCPRQDSNLRTRFRRPVLYPLSYGGGPSDGTPSVHQHPNRWGRLAADEGGEDGRPDEESDPGLRCIENGTRCRLVRAMGQWVSSSACSGADAIPSGP
jgi:hypothetical protein